MKVVNIKVLDKWFLPRGKCGFCGHKDARHRLWDALMDVPETDKETACWYELPVAAVRAVRKIRPYR